MINGHNHQYERTDVIKKGKVSKKLPIGGTAYPETDGVVYVTAGAAGRSLYAFSAPLSYEGHENEVESVSSFINAKGGKSERDRQLVSGPVLDYSFLRVDVTPASQGRTATLRVRGIAETGAEVDHFTVAREAGSGLVASPRGRGAASVCGRGPGRSAYMPLSTACLASVNSSSVRTPDLWRSPSSRRRRRRASWSASGGGAGRR